ncbi:cyclin-D-binding Myb-like transcription factor 1 [Neltuma alba]|uniref:cyclin-D-binding Myb-like transcription factor 1 n=1 Tax=Neltuma alba TaxID=207710 RepID=UPI0010A5592F|nr:cyclin-D-binding Myb-like transcription factor 1 [Prosopis alba]XP_028797735.1 cyclin-D-binding Myb-like transcription factor 1 [Prosopis alba]
MRITEENSKGNRKKRKKGKDNDEIINGIIDRDNEMQFLDDKQERKTKKRKHCNDSIPEMQEVFALKLRGENNGTEAIGLKSNEAGSSLAGAKTIDANTDSVVMNNDDQGKKIKKKLKEKKKLTSKSKRTEDDEFKSNGGDQALAESDEGDPNLEKSNMGDAVEHASFTKGDDQGEKKKKKMKKKKSKEDKVKFSDQALAESDEGDPNLAKHNMGDAVEHASFIKGGDQDEKKKKMKKNKKSKEDKRVKFSDQALAESDEGDPDVAKHNVGDAAEHASFTKGDDQGKKKKKMKKKKKSKKDKRVKFSEQVEVFNDHLVQGKRFTPEEDEKIIEAIYNYIYSHGLGDRDQGVDMILHCSSYPKIRGCWKEIASALPHRPLESVYHRGHILFERDDSRKWTPEELEIVRNFHKKHGSNWKMLADAMGKHRFHVKDAWRRIKLGNINRGNWSQEEYQKLFDLVNADLCLRALEDKRKQKHGMLRDNICWEAIGDKVATRTSQLCCMKWYEKLTSPLVAEGEWADTDDYRLLNALYTLDACCMEEVEWDYLLEHRSGDVCRKRWNQMVQHIGEHGNKSFSEQVEILSKRYRPDLVEAREAFDNKPVIP